MKRNKIQFPLSKVFDVCYKIKTFLFRNLPKSFMDSFGLSKKVTNFEYFRPEKIHKISTLKEKLYSNRQGKENATYVQT